MAFFGLTQKGYQNTIKEVSIESQQQPIRANTQLGYLALPPIQDKNPPVRSIVPINQTSQYGAGPVGSFVEYTRLRTKHTRNPAGPHQIYNRPATTSQLVGWWTKEEPIKQNQNWAHVPRRAKLHSEMSRFVDQMKLTNKEFTMF